MLNVEGCVEVGLTVFGGENTELGASDLPAGLSPKAVDCAFLPGQVFTRPPLQQFSSLGTTNQIVNQHSYFKPDGSIVQIQLDSAGGIYADGVLIGQTQSGNRMFCKNAFGSCFMAFSDGLHGIDVPRQYTPEGYFDRVSQDGPAGAPTLANFSLPPVQLVSGPVDFLIRYQNQVTAYTASAHNLNVGNQVAISGVVDGIVGTSISSIVIDNTKYPGQALVTTSSAHGLSPNLDVLIGGVQNVSVGGGIAHSQVIAGQATVTFNSPHGLQVGAYVLVSASSSGTPGPYLPFTVTSIPSPTQIAYSFNGPDASYTSGDVILVWPGNQNTDQTYTVQGINSPTSFFINLTYSDGTWTTGTVTFPWVGTFTVVQVLSPTSFVYRQEGPNGNLVFTPLSGFATPVGQIAPGDRPCVVIFQTRTGYLTKPGPKATYSANGGAYLSISGVPTGPSNTLQRIIAFPAANGGSYFYLAVAPRDPSGSYIIGTSTVIPDNTTTSAIFDFSDQALLDGIAIDIPGNNLFEQEILGPCLAFGAYKSRLTAWGDRDTIQQFWNMGFEGGISSGPSVLAHVVMGTTRLPTSSSLPLGWTQTGLGSVIAGIVSEGAFLFGAGGSISQTAYIDQFGAPILQAQTQYSFRLYTEGTGNVTISLTSISTGTIATLTLASVPLGGWVEGALSSATGPTIPSDSMLTIAGDSGVLIDELSLFYTQNPYRLASRDSYVNNPQSFDGVTGILGPAGDPNPVLGMQERNGVLCILTAGPKGSLYEVEDTASGEPVTWDIRHKASRCGLISIWGLASFEDWFCWASDTGLRIFNGGDVEKLSQEIQGWWDSFNPATRQLTVLGNDPYTRRIYVLACTELAAVTNQCYVLDYRELNTSNLLASAGTLRIGISGKVVTTDLTRKWSPWSITANYCSLIYADEGDPVFGFCGGTGYSLSAPLHSAVYSLQEGALTGIDADYGTFWQNFQYSTYFFISDDDAQQKQLGTHRLLHEFMTLNVSGEGAVVITPQVNFLGNDKRSTRAVGLNPDLGRDLEFGLNVTGERISYRFNVQPYGPQPFDPLAPAGMTLSSMILALQTHPFSPVRGRNS